MNVFDLQAILTLDTKGYDTALDSSEKSASNWGGKIGKVAKGAAVAFTAVATAAGATATALIKGVGNVAAYGDNIDKMSQKMGMSAQAYQEWDQILQHNGSSMESMKAGMKTLANAVENGSDAFTRLGLSQEEVAKMSQEELFAATIEGLQNVEDTTERTYLAGKLLGKGATELGPLLNMTSEELEDMRQRTHELGGVMSDEAVKASAKYQDTLQDMKFALSGVSRGMLSEMMPSITTVMEGLTEIFAGNSAGGIAKLNEGVSQFVAKMQETVPKIIEIAKPILSALGNAILENLPMLLSVGVEVVTSIAVSLVEALPALIVTLVPALISMAVQIVAAIVKALPQILQAIVNAVGDVVRPIIKTLSDKFPAVGEVFEALVDIVKSVTDTVKGIWDKWGSTIVEAAKNVWETIKTVIQSALGIIKGVIQVVSGIITGDWEKVWTGIKNIVSSAWNAIKSIITTVLSNIKLVISKVFTSIREKISSVVEGIKTKISNTFSNIKNTIATVIGNIKATISSGFNAAKSTVSSVFNSIKSSISEKINGAKDKVKTAIDKIKRFFNFSWSLPKLKLPHLSITGSFNLLPPSTPKFSIEWYKKAYNNAYLFDKPTVGVGLGFGDGVGGEMVVGEGYLMNKIGDAMESRIGNLGEIVGRMYEYMQLYFPMFASAELTIDGDAMVGTLAPKMDLALGELNARKARG